MKGILTPVTRAAPLVLLLVLGCRGDRSAETVVDFWALGREGEVVTKLLPEFERRNPGVRVQIQQVPWSAAHEKLLTAFAGDSLPDVVQVGNTWIAELQALDAIEPLGDRISASKTLDAKDFFPGILDTNAIDGTIYGIPWYVDARVLFYRTDLLTEAGFDAPPRTWASWVEMMTKIRKSAGPERYAILLPMNDWRFPVILALQLGAPLLRDDDRYGDFESPGFRRAFTFYLDLFRADLAPRAGDTQIANLYRDFALGYFAFYLSGPWDIGEFQTRLPASLEGAWATAPLPAPEGGQYPGVSTAGGASLALVRASQEKDAGRKLIEYLAEPAQQIEFHRLIGDLPSRMSAWREAALDRDRHASAFWLQLQNVRATPKIPEWERVASKITQFGEAAIRGSMTIDQALKALDEDVDQVLEKRRWLLRKDATSGQARGTDGASR